MIDCSLLAFEKAQYGFSFGVFHAFQLSIKFHVAPKVDYQKKSVLEENALKAVMEQPIC